MDENKKIFKPDFLIIPYQILVDNNLTPVDKVIYGVIYWFKCLKNEKCSASNNTIAEIANTTAGTVQNSLLRLENGGYIKRVFSDMTSMTRKEIIPLVKYGIESTTTPPLNSDTPPLDDGTPLPLIDDHNNNIINKNIDNINIIKANAQEENDFSFSEQKPKTKKTDFRNPYIQSIINRFSEYYGIKIPPVKARNGFDLNRSATQRLIKQHGMKKLNSMLDRVFEEMTKNRNGDEEAKFFPKVSCPLDFENKFIKIKDYFIRKAKVDLKKEPVQRELTAEEVLKKIDESGGTLIR